MSAMRSLSQQVVITVDSLIRTGNNYICNQTALLFAAFKLQTERVPSFILRSPKTQGMS